ncbi:MAG: hypothetical protein NVSMB47_06210 [Polyangiales bacterium]
MHALRTHTIVAAVDASSGRALASFGVAPHVMPAHPATGAMHDADAIAATNAMIAALRAVSHGADASEILGENPKWEKIFAALLSLLLRKHLIADWEFVEEYRKI